MTQAAQPLPLRRSIRPTPFGTTTEATDGSRLEDNLERGGRDQAANQDHDELFRQLWTQYGSSLYYFVLKRVRHPDDASEIAQQAFVEAACSFASFRGEAELSTWIFGIANNLARNHMNRAPQHRHHFETEEVLEECESGECDPRDRAALHQSLKLTTDAMRQLPREMCRALTMVAVDGLSYEEAASELGVPVGTVRSRVSRARAALRERLAEAGVTHLY